jgi:hypothetical protein
MHITHKVFNILGSLQAGRVFKIGVTVALTVLYSVVIENEDFDRRQAMEKIFRFDFDLRVTNAETGEVIQNISVLHPNPDFGETEVPDWMKTVRGSSPQSEDASYQLHGYAMEPFEFGVSAEGLETKTNQVDRQTQSPIEVELAPVSNSNQ